MDEAVFCDFDTRFFLLYIHTDDMREHACLFRVRMKKCKLYSEYIGLIDGLYFGFLHRMYSEISVDIAREWNKNNNSTLM